MSNQSKMKIEIEAVDLLEILVDAGINPNDAKSLVFDILARQSGVPMVREPAPAPRQQPTPRQQVRVQAPVAAPVAPVDNDDDYDSEEQQEQEQERTSVSRTRVSYSSQTPSQQEGKPMNFSNFGGSYNGMGKQR